MRPNYVVDRADTRGHWLDGFTLVELVVSLAIAVTLAAIAIPMYVDYLEKARIARAIAEIHIFDKAIDLYELDTGSLPDDLAEAGLGAPLDPWGYPYEYLKIAGAGKGGGGKPRKDRFLVPINSDYDLYSKGKDGESVAPLTAKKSRDDIIRANDGAFVGLALEF